MLANFSNLITFSRGSNATLTDASGRLTYAPNNLVTNSQDFEAAGWSKTAATVTANTAVAPDGTTTADKAVATAASGYHGVGQSVTFPNGLSILSVYAKAAEYSLFRVFDFNSGDFAASFNLTNGAVSNTGGARFSSASATAVGNGWYRCTLILNNVSAARSPAFVGYPAGATLDLYGAQYTGDGTSGILIWGAQLEAVTYQTTPSPYVSTSVANLLGFSEAFDNAGWNKSNASVVPNVAQNPINGLWNAQKLMEDTSTNFHRVSQVPTLAAVPTTASVYAKAAERNWLYFANASSTQGAYFNLSTGAVGTLVGSATASIQSVGNGWYRCSITSTPTAGAQNYSIYVANADASYVYAGNGNSGIYIYGAQLSNSGSLDPYVPTPGAAPSSTAYYGPRYDYDPVTLAAKGILIEEQRTNLLTYSNTFNNAAWTWASGATGTLSQNVLSPEGSVNAWTIADTDNTAAQLIQQSATLTAVTHTFSCYFKKTTGAQSTYPVLLVVNGGNLNGAVCTVDTTNGVATVWTAFTGWTIVTSTATCTDAGSYWRVSLTFLGQSAGFLMRIAPAGTSNPTQSTGTLATNLTGSTVVYGAQIEAGAFATSYIPTVASQVTRNADVASITGSLFSQWFNQGEGTIVMRATTIPSTNYRDFIRISDGTDNNFARVRIYSGTPTTALAIGEVYSGAAAQAIMQTADITLAPLKYSLAFAPNSFATVLNGGSVVTDTSGTLPLNVSQLTVTGGPFFCGSVYVQNITYYPNRLPNDQLQAITK